MADLKARLRKEARAIRQSAARADPGAAEALAARAPPDLLARRVVALYWPQGSEIDPGPLARRFREAGAHLLLPFMETPDGPCRLRLWEAQAPLAPDALKVLSPADPGPDLTPDLIFTPLLAFDRAGARLGQGGGWYDRLLTQWRPSGALAVGLAYAAQERPHIPQEPHDQRVDWVLTEREAVRCA